MTGARLQRKPTFLWQGILILLPVIILALVSLTSLRLDEQAAEREARKRAVDSVQSLVRAIRSTVSEELQRYLNLQGLWRMELGLSSLPGLVDSDPELASDIANWERDYPGLKLADVCFPDCKLLADGRQIDPREIPVAPRPPKWFRELTPSQRADWDALRERAATNGITDSMLEDFSAGGVSAEARRAAANLKARSFNAKLSDGDISETGISFRGILLFQRLADPDVLLSDILKEEGFQNEILSSPSFISPVLLEMAEAKSSDADTATSAKVRSIRQLWNIQSRARECLEGLRRLPGLRDRNQKVLHWIPSNAGESLAIFQPMTFEAVFTGHDWDGVPLSGPGYGISFVPRVVVEAIFSRALEENRFLIPAYAWATISVEGKSLNLPNSGQVQRDSPLGSATQAFGKYALLDAGTFDVTLFLISREQLLSAEHRRARLFGLLILGTVVTAVAGLIAARRAFGQQLRLNEMKSNFVSSVSHELRAPIASVRLMAESLERGKIHEPQKQNEYFRFIGQECRRLSSLIENVLDYSRIDQGRKQYEFEPTDLAALARETVKLMEPYAAEKGVELKMGTPNIEHRTSNAEGTPAPGRDGNGAFELTVDGRAIQQALVNLIDNAIKHSPKGESVTVGLEVSGARGQVSGEVVPGTAATHLIPGTSPLTPFSDSHLTLHVSDHGPGIPKEEHEKIFERFYRLGSELRRETQGVGIGLSIVQHVVEAHGGRVRVESEVGKGSRFTIELPMK